VTGESVGKLYAADGGTVMVGSGLARRAYRPDELGIEAVAFPVVARAS